MPVTRRHKGSLQQDGIPKVESEISETIGSSKRARASPSSTPSSSPQKNKKLKLISDFGTVSPFPDFAHPSPSDAQSIFDLLLSTHPEFKNKLKNTRVTPENSQDVNSAQTCGKVHDVIDSLIGTILSQNTSGKNSSGAKRNLDATFGRHNFKAIAEAPREQLVEALRSGGLANKKAAVIQNVLKEIHERHGKYSLQHLASLSDEEVMKELQSYAGVGPKTASCVLLFCLGRDSFAVDTHVYRLTRLLGWVPPKADRVMAQAHLDIRVPNHLKYGLHVMLIGHGRKCSGCKGDGSRGACVLKTWLKEKKGLKGEEVEEREDEIKEEVEQVEAKLETES